VSQDKVEIVRRSIEAFGRGDLEGVLDTVAPGFEFEPSGRFMDTQTTYRGREGFLEFWNDFRPAGRTSRFRSSAWTTSVIAF
jgi:ketosteroid isomerase-like protein